VANVSKAPKSPLCLITCIKSRASPK